MEIQQKKYTENIGSEIVNTLTNKETEIGNIMDEERMLALAQVPLDAAALSTQVLLGTSYHSV